MIPVHRKTLLLTLLGALVPCGVHASNGTEGAAFLDIPVGAGPAAMGSAYSALATDAYGTVYNPAGLGRVSRPELAAQHLSYLETIHYEFGSAVFPLGGDKMNHQPATRALGVAIQYLGAGDIGGTDTTGASIGDFSAHYAAYSLAYGQQVGPRLSAGVTTKLIEAKLADASAKAVAFDFGGLFQASERLRLAATLSNLGTGLKFDRHSDPLPFAAKAGAAYQVNSALTAAYEGVVYRTGKVASHFGFEWAPLQAIALRTGYKTETTDGLSPLAGFTTGLGIRFLGQEFSYAWLPYGDLGNTQYFSLLLKFGAIEDQRRNLIQYQNIKKHRSVKEPSKDDVESEHQQLMQLLEDKRDPTAQVPAPTPLRQNPSKN